jgi:hypothetical protein
MGYYRQRGTTSANFLGTTDRQPLVLKTNRSEVLRIDINGHVGIGTGHHKQILVTIETAYEESISVGCSGLGATITTMG